MEDSNAFTLPCSGKQSWFDNYKKFFPKDHPCSVPRNLLHHIQDPVPYSKILKSVLEQTGIPCLSRPGHERWGPFVVYCFYQAIRYLSEAFIPLLSEMSGMTTFLNHIQGILRENQSLTTEEVTYNIGIHAIYLNEK